MDITYGVLFSRETVILHKKHIENVSNFLNFL